ncbi:unnamed protein product [Soboliphyme baturini]|uniref:DUF4477 domain-containing protein n=1 Tax=Soboliphyme baturini TaxID=241478 RepID=A0A183IK11_9BILA|nr:unnamed protein product [Soboliphyme baturini]
MKASYADQFSEDSYTAKFSSDRWDRWSHRSSGSVFDGTTSDMDDSSMNTVVSAVSPMDRNAATSESGISDSTSVYPVVENTQLKVQCQQMIEHLKSMLTYVYDFYVVVCHGQREHYHTLLRELSLKIRPNLIRMDEQVVSRQEVVRKNLDKCHISDHSVQWLLQFNKLFITMREIIGRLTLVIIDELERIITLKIRGCGKVLAQYDLEEEMDKIVCSVQSLAIELSKQDAVDDIN